MVVEAHKVLKKRRHRHRHFYNEEPEPVHVKQKPDVKPTVIDIFDFPKDEDYSTIIKAIGTTAIKRQPANNINRSKSCSDILATNIQTLDHSPRHRRLISISEVFKNPNAFVDEGEREEGCSLMHESNGDPKPAACVKTDNESNDTCSFDSETNGIFFTVPTEDATEKETVPHPDGGETRFTISKVVEKDLSTDKDEKG